MRGTHRTPVFHVVILLLLFLGAPAAPAALHESEKLTLSGDLRARLESDWDSRTAAGAPREDRTRLRLRARLSAELRPAPGWKVALRVRSGAEESQQSPHVTLVDFDDNDTGDADFDADRWSLRWERDGGWVAVGRDPFPFWRPNEMYWDDDVTLAGVAGGWGRQHGADRFELIGGFFALPVGLRKSSGNLAGLQFVHTRGGERTEWKSALALFDVDANPADPDAATLLDGNGGRDYRILVGSLQLRLPRVGRGLTVGGDLLRNLEDYSPTDPDPFTAANRDETNGFVIDAAYGRLSEVQDWLVGYTYARIETLAVLASYAQDDWVRWGNATQTRSSDLRGHELRFGYQVLRQANLLVRLFLVDAITSIEDGNRARVDFNLRF